MKPAVAILALCLAAACGSDPIQGGNTVHGSIRGNVTDNTGASVPNATIELTGNAQAARSTNSGADGVYSFANVPAGTYALAVTPPTGWTAGVAGTASVTVAGGAQALAAAMVLNRGTGDPCVVEPGSIRPNFGGAATAADRSIFAYDVSAPLNLVKTVESTTNGVETSVISFTSPGGGIATGMLFDPVGRLSQRPGIVLMHGMPGTARQMATYGQTLASYGAVVIAIDAPFARRQGTPLRHTAEDRDEQIQLIKDLQRAVDVLRAISKVDDNRIAYVGVSYGGAMGALFAGVERRLKAAVLVVGDGGLVTHFTGPEDLNYIAVMACATRLQWFAAMAPIEPIRFIGLAAPTPLLLQNGRFDTLVPMADGQQLQTAAPEPKTLRWYDAGHGLNQQAVLDRHNWLVQQIGLDALQ